jgi:hypothetical protein
VPGASPLCDACGRAHPPEEPCSYHELALRARGYDRHRRTLELIKELIAPYVPTYATSKLTDMVKALIDQRSLEGKSFDSYISELNERIAERDRARKQLSNIVEQIKPHIQSSGVDISPTAAACAYVGTLIRLNSLAAQRGDALDEIRELITPHVAWVGLPTTIELVESLIKLFEKCIAERDRARTKLDELRDLLSQSNRQLNTKARRSVAVDAQLDGCIAERDRARKLVWPAR